MDIPFQVLSKTFEGDQYTIDLGVSGRVFTFRCPREIVEDEQFFKQYLQNVIDLTRLIYSGFAEQAASKS